MAFVLDSMGNKIQFLLDGIRMIHGMEIIWKLMLMICRFVSQGGIKMENVLERLRMIRSFLSSRLKMYLNRKIFSFDK